MQSESTADEPSSDGEAVNSIEDIGIAPYILEHLSHFDLSGSVAFNARKFYTAGACGDLFKGNLFISGEEKTTVAVKRFRFYRKKDMKLLFEREIYVWSKLAHPNILPLLGFTIDSLTGFPVLVSKWMDNGSAWEYVKSNPDCDVINLLVGVAKGLDYLHEQGVVHSDIKSDNIVVSKEGTPLLCDFGCSRMIDASQAFAKTMSTLVGTPRYLAYELLVPQKDRSNRFSGHTSESDVWAFGMVIFELCLRQRPYAEINDIQAIAAITRRQLPRFPRDAHSKRKWSDIRRVCLACWNRDPSFRPSIQTILENLNDIQPDIKNRQIKKPDELKKIALHFCDIDPETLPPDLKKEGSDWFAIFNPKVKRVLDINLANTLNHESVVCCVRFSADGKYLATGCNRTAQIYDTKTGQKICVLNDESANPVGDLYIRSVCFSPDGKLLATGAEDKTIRIWEIAKKRVKRVFEGHTQEIYSLDFSKNGRLIVSGSGDRTTRIWDMETGMQKVLEINEPDRVDAGVTSVVISPDGRFVAAGSLDTVVRIWEMQSGILMERLKGHRDSVYSVAFTPDGKGIVSGSHRVLGLSGRGYVGEYR